MLTLDWVGFSRGHGGWFADDGLHLGRGGAAGLARLLGRGLRRVYPLMARSAQDAVPADPPDGEARRDRGARGREVDAVALAHAHVRPR